MTNRDPLRKAKSEKSLNPFLNRVVSSILSVHRVRNSITPKLIVPFTLIVVVVTVCMATSFCSLMSDTFNRSLLKKSRVLNDNLLQIMSDSFQMGEWTRVQRMLTAAKEADEDISAISLVANDGQVLASTNPALKQGSVLSPAEFEKWKVDKFTVREGDNKEFFETLCLVGPADAQQAVLKIRMSRKNINALMAAEQARASIIGFFGLVVGIGFYGIIITVQIIKPIQTLSQAARDLARGDVVDSVKISTKDEIGELSRSINELIRYFSDMSEVATSIARGNLGVSVARRSELDVFGSAFSTMVESLKQIMTRLSVGANQLSETASQLAVSSTQQSTLVAQQYSSLQSSMVTLENITAMVNEASSRAHSVLEISEQSLIASNRGLESLEAATGCVLKIREQVGRMGQNIAQLTKSAGQIGNITATVEEIAMQSEVLTINGSIEAARLGAEGKAFHVVAKEVKNLSLQSKDATDQVRAMLVDIEKSAETALHVVREGDNRVEEGVQQIHQVGATFNDLYKTIMDCVEAAKMIADTAENQVRQITDMSQAMELISTAAGETAAASRQQNETARELSALAASINSIVQSYSSVAGPDEYIVVNPNSMPHSSISPTFH